MALACLVALEAVFVSTLLLAHLTVPSQLRQALRLNAIADRLRREEAMFWHGDTLVVAVS